MFRVLEDSMSNIMNDVGISTVFPEMNIHVNIKEHADKFEVFAKIPGYKKEDIDISFNENALVLEGKMKHEENKEEEGFLMQEYRQGNFRRMITLPKKVDTEKVEASLEDGVLKVEVAKLPEIMPKKIEIK